MDAATAKNAARTTLKSLRSQAYFLVVFSVGLGLLAWYLLSRFGGIQPYLLPAPGAVWERFLTSLSDGTLLRNTFYTLSEVLSGLVLGVVSASTLGYLLAKSRPLEQILAPLIVASQSVPIVAIAPLLILWLGSGILPKILICTLVVFFPVLINTIVGLRSVPPDLRDLMRSLQATRWQTFSKLEVPAAMPVLLGGVRIGTALSVIGAVVGEFVAADRGLGFLINQARGIYDTSLVFVAVFALIFMALSLYGLVVLLEARFLSWQNRVEGTIWTQK